jgi:outer membrane immunogenic protein
MRILLPRTLIVATLFAATGARAADLAGGYAGSTVADFSGIGIGLDGGAGIGAANGSSISGGIGGAHVGYNLQNGQIVGGVEADAMLGSVQGGLGGGTFSQEALASARVKGGYAFGSFLAYGTVGGAWSSTDYMRLGNTSSRSLPGVAYGLGGEFAVTRNVSVRAELMRYNFEGAAYAAPGGSQPATTSTNLLRVGATVHF